MTYEVRWTERGKTKSFAVDGDEAAAYAACRVFMACRVFLAGARHDPAIDAHSVRVRERAERR